MGWSCLAYASGCLWVESGLTRRVTLGAFFDRVLVDQFEVCIYGFVVVDVENILWAG
jgi:hypothetical protein